MSEWYRMTVDALKDCNKKYLAQLAKDQGISGWHAMRKDQLIRALSAPRTTASRSKSGSRSGTPPARKTKPAARTSSANGNGRGRAYARPAAGPAAAPPRSRHGR